MQVLEASKHIPGNGGNHVLVLHALRVPVGGQHSKFCLAMSNPDGLVSISKACHDTLDGHQAEGMQISGGAPGGQDVGEGAASDEGHDQPEILAGDEAAVQRQQVGVQQRPHEVRLADQLILRQGMRPSSSMC